MGLFSMNQDTERPPPLGGGPFGHGDPDDKRLRKAEKDILIARMLREEATKRCDDFMKTFMNCATESPFLYYIKCKEERKAKDSCIKSYADNPEFVQEITDKYLYARSYYRRTGEPLEKYERKKSVKSGFC